MTEFNFTFPCSVGDVVWCISPRKEIRQEKIDRIIIVQDATFCLTDKGSYYLGREIFATRKEAKKALEGMV